MRSFPAAANGGCGMHKIPKPGKSRLYRKEAVSAWLFLAPFLLGISVFYLYAFFNNVYISFTNKKSFGIPDFIGFANYQKLFASDKFYLSLFNTFKYVLICVPAVIIISVLLATLLNSKIKGKGFYRTMIFIPAVTMPAAIGLVWRWMMNYEFGLINAALEGLGLPRVAWLADPKISLIAVSIVLIWTDVSTRMVILLAGLQGIPKVYYEAAKIDGAGPVRQFFRITLPMLSPTIFFCMVMEIIGVFQIFDFIYLMMRRGSSGMPGARSIVTRFYEEAFISFNKGYAAAISIVLFFIILVITIVQMVAKKYWVHDE